MPWRAHAPYLSARSSFAAASNSASVAGWVGINLSSPRWDDRGPGFLGREVGDPGYYKGEKVNLTADDSTDPKVAELNDWQLTDHEEAGEHGEQEEERKRRNSKRLLAGAQTLPASF